MATPAGGLQLGGGLSKGISLSLGQPSAQKGPQPSLLSSGLTSTLGGASTTASLPAQTTTPVPSSATQPTATLTQPTTTLTQPGLGGTTSLTQPGLAGTTALTQPGLAGTKGLPTQPSGPPASKGKKYTYRELQELITAWTSELEENEKLFLKQAQQMSEWDKTLTDNAEGIINIHNDLDVVKTEQNKLEKELDLILAQQKDIEELLLPLEEKARYHQPSSQQKADVERERIYTLAENLDQQMQQMEQSLAEIIEHINTASSERDPNTPIAQIAKILNAHASSLQWIERNAGILSNQLERIG